MSAGGPTDIRLDTGKVSARLGVTPRQVARMVRRPVNPLPAPHYLGERKRWWLSEIVAWESENATPDAPETVRRGAGNLRNAIEAVS